MEGRGELFPPLLQRKKLVVKPNQFIVLLWGRYSAVGSLNIVRCEPAISPACPVDRESPSCHADVIPQKVPSQQGVSGRPDHDGGDDMDLRHRVNVTHTVGINAVKVTV